MTPVLTEREQKVLFLLSKGKKNHEIAKELFISVGTTKVHLDSIYVKFGVSNRVQAAMKGVFFNFVNIKDAVDI